MDHKPDDLEVSKEIFRLLLDRGFDVNREYTEWAGWTEEGPAKSYQAFKVLHDIFGPFTEAMYKGLLADYMHLAKRTPGVLHAGVEIIEFLISCGASVNGTNVNGETALHVAYTLSKTSPLPIGEKNDVLAWDLDEEQGFTVGWAVGTNSIGQQTIDGFLSGLLSGPMEVEKRVKNATAIFDILIKAGADQSVVNDKGETPAMVMYQHGWLQLPPSPGSDSGSVPMAEAKSDSAQDENILSSAFAIYKRLQELVAAQSVTT
ncbi:hypothetical protein BDP81DRAFT_453342 [Colletotrichum phormii]|uniref:Ankyrin repeat protein n=1 Tax=Colletotrichum phormii TaxID=359342 RepID=A0AAJ0EB20_9PEZI|nr:uncharacterized protein BDP81DRAFT_453342 [Colletotrichum phormii]KAK1624585.1 hypothetical protein BDP81DRAFT_453342 [Colletotrichum phormii]